jgi:hypothetical protein
VGSTVTGGMLGASGFGLDGSYHQAWFGASQTSGPEMPMVIGGGASISNWTAYFYTASTTAMAVPMRLGLGLYMTYNSGTATDDQDFWSPAYNPSATTAYASSGYTPRYIPQGMSTGVSAISLAASGGPNLTTVSAALSGINAQLLGTTFAGGTVASGATIYTNGSQGSSLNTTTINTMEAMMPYTSGGTISNLGFVQTAAGTAALTASLVKNESTTPTAVAVATPAASIAFGLYQDAAHSVSFNQGDRFAAQLVQGAATGATMGGLAFEVVPNGGTAVGLVVFGMAGASLPSAGSTWLTPTVNYASTTGSGTYAPMAVPYPSGIDMMNLGCWVTTAPLAQPATFTLWRNGSPTNVVVTIPTTQSVPGPATDYYAATGHYQAYNNPLASPPNPDTFILKYNQAAGGTAPVVSSCTLELATAPE